MARAAMIKRMVLGLAGLVWAVHFWALHSVSALAQDQSAPSPVNPAPVDPAAALSGVWRVDRVEGDYDTAAALIGRVLRIDRNSAATLASGTCGNPSFAIEQATGAIAVTCLGAILARAEPDAVDATTVKWAEPNVQAVLHRISAATTESAAGDADSGAGDASGADDTDANGEGDAQ
jgi:hypothetical protein